jgi:hypothetical protein
MGWAPQPRVTRWARAHSVAIWRGNHGRRTRAPFGPNLGCLAKYGLTPAKEKVLLARLGQLNTVLAQGAQTFGFGLADPPFTGHELCTAEPYVQGPTDPAPLHPTVTGELIIALADQQALPKLENPAPTAEPINAGPR